MTKESVVQKKIRVKWRSKGPTCSNCKSYESRVENRKTLYGNWPEEKGIKCNKEGFATKKTSWCPSHEFRTE